MVHVLSEKGSSKGKDYCILFNSQWAHLPHDLGKAVSTYLTDDKKSIKNAFVTRKLLISYLH